MELSPMGLACNPHGVKSHLICESTLPSGLPCPYSICDLCWDYIEGKEDILPTRTSIYCFDCLNNLNGHKCQVTPVVQEPTKNNHCVGTMFHNSTFAMPLYTQKSIETNKAPQASAEMRIPLISTEKEMIDLSQLSNSPSTPRKNLVVDISSEVNYTPDHIKPKRLFSSLRDTIDTNKNVSFGTIHQPASYAQLSTDDDHSSDNDDAKIPARTYKETKNSQNVCSGYKAKPSVVGGINQNEDEPVDGNTLITAGAHLPIVRSRVRNPYNNVATSVALNATAYALEESHPIHVPDWYLNMIVSNNSPEVTGEAMRKMCWLTHDLQTEIETHFPGHDEIKIDRVTGICSRDLDAFMSKCTHMFPKGRIFMSEEQLNQAAKYFLDAWNVKKVHNSKKIQCYYGIGRKKNYVSTCAPDKRRHVEPSLKEQYNCPFHIAYNHIGVCNKLKKPRIFYHVKITNLNTTHSCELSTQCYRNAHHSSRGQVKISLSGMHSLLHILKVTPSTPASVLRPLLNQFVDNGTAVDAQFMSNFRTRVAYYHAKNPSNHENQVDISLSDATSLLSRKVLSQEEHSILDNPLVRLNFNVIMKRIIEEDNTTWEAFAFLKECKMTMPGFDFRIKLDKSTKRPIALVFLTAEGRKNLLRYPNIIFTDAQNREHNNFGWPYIALVVKDMDMKIAVTCEALAITEDLETYSWILRSQADMEPRWKLSDLKIIFGDQRITTTLLNMLKIEDTCLLRGDYYHLMKEVFPTSEFFGTHVMNLIEKDLRNMLLTSKEAEWNASYSKIVEVLKDDPAKIRKLDKIKDNPSYCAGCYLKKIKGNLDLNGSAPAEQNHSSVIAFLGKGHSDWSIMAHTGALMKRQAEHSKQHKRQEDKLHAQSLKYKSKMVGQQGVDDQIAKKCLSMYAYKELYAYAARYSANFQKYYDNLGNCHIWPIGTERTANNSTIITNGNRCECFKCTAFQYQCKHELVDDGKFLVSKYASMWLNNHKFLEMNSHLSPYMELSRGTSDIFELSTIDNELTVERNSQLTDVYANASEVNIDLNQDDVNSSDKTQKISYGDLMVKLGELARTVQNDQHKCAAVIADIDQMIMHYRNDNAFMLNFVVIDGDTTDKSGQPIRSVTNVLPTVSRHVRKKSMLERIRGSYANSADNVDLSQASNTTLSVYHDTGAGDIDHLTARSIRTRSCTLCRQKKHGKFQCPILLAYGNAPIPKNDLHGRQTLSMNLSQKHIYSVHKKSKDDKREVMKSMPMSIPALIIHRRLLIKDDLANPLVPENFCLECTFLKDSGDEDERYTKVLFGIKDVSTFLTKSKTNVIVSLLDQA